MSATKFPSEINEHTAKLIVGLIAITLAIAEYFLTCRELHSVSESYLFDGWARNVFVGSLCAIGAFMFSYNGKEPFQTFQMIMSKVAALAALGIAMFPCLCNRNPDDLDFPYVHGISTLILFIILILFCYFFFKRAWGKYLKARAKGESGWAPKTRAGIYLACGGLIFASMVLLAIDKMLDDVISKQVPNLTFYCEYVALSSFGGAWLIAGGHVLPGKIKAMLKRYGLI
jgi:hypothetical protein